MIFKRRWLRILLILVGLFLFVGYFAFATFVFPPHEGAYKYDIAALIPRDVDFFAAKAELRRDFDPFPHLAFVEDMADNPSFQAFLESPEWAQFREENGLDELESEIERQLDQIPLGLDPLSIFGGKDLGIAGRFRGGSFTDADWAVYGRANWAGKLAVALLRLGWLPEVGFGVEKSGGVLQLSGGQLTRPVFLTRIRDVIVLGTSQELVAGALDLAAHRGENSLLASADYNDNIATVKRNPRKDEVELIVDMRDLLRNLGQEGELPDSHAEAFMPAFLGKVFQAPACKKVMGVLGLHEGLQVDLHGGLASEKISDDQRAIYMRRGFSHDDILTDIARVAPENCCLFVYLHGPIDILLKQVLASMEPATRSLLEENFRNTGEYTSLDELVDDLASGLANRLALVVAPNDFPEEVEGPPHDDRVVFLVSLVVWYSDGGKKVEELRELIGQHGRIFGLEGREPGSGGYYTNQIEGSMLHEFWNRAMIPGTGIIATFNKDYPGKPGQGRAYVFNNHMAAGTLSRTYNLGRADGYPRLSERLDFQALLNESLDSANVMIWFNPRTAAPTLRAQAKQEAQAQAESALSGERDWATVRRQVEADMLAEHWPGKSKGDLDEGDQFRFEQFVLDELARRRRVMVRELAPQLESRMLRRIEWSQMVSAGLLMLQLDPREFRLSLRTVVPMD